MAFGLRQQGTFLSSVARFSPGGTKIGQRNDGIYHSAEGQNHARGAAGYVLIFDAEPKMPDIPIVIVGGGAAGLSTAGALRHAGLDAVVLDKDRQIGGTWARRYDRLHLHTIRPLSGLAHFPIPRHLPRYLSRNQLVAYLRDYARRFDLKIIGGCAARKVRMASDRPRPAWVVESDCGTWRCRVVVIATGHYGIPVVPDWPGRAEYRGPLIHSLEYRNGRAYAGKRVLVIGAGNSGTEIAADLAEHGAALVAISIRTPPPIVPRDPFGTPIQRSGLLLSRLPPWVGDRVAQIIPRLVFGNLARYGIDTPAWLPYSARHVPVIDVGFVAALKRGQVHVRPNVDHFTPTGVVYVDGRAEDFDAVIAATGFKTGLPELLDAPGTLDERGFPAYPSGQPTAQPGLYFMGYTQHLRGHLYEANRDSRRLAGIIKAYLQLTPRGDAPPAA
jgi:putative flavoprotein involved in K+ transport